MVAMHTATEIFGPNGVSTRGSNAQRLITVATTNLDRPRAGERALGDANHGGIALTG